MRTNRPAALDRSFEVTIRDGRRVLIRPVRPADQEPLAALRAAVNRPSCARHLLEPPTATAPRHPTEADRDRLVAWIAVPRGDRHAGVGIVRFVRDAEDPRAAEIVIAVANDYQSAGLGKLLGETIVLSALEEGIATLVGYVRPDDVVARRLMQRLGASPPQRRGDGLLRVEVPVGVGPRTFRAGMPSPHGPGRSQGQRRSRGQLVSVMRLEARPRRAGVEGRYPGPRRGGYRRTGMPSLPLE